jgi:hypothetical protein
LDSDADAPTRSHSSKAIVRPDTKKMSTLGEGIDELQEANRDLEEEYLRNMCWHKRFETQKANSKKKLEEPPKEK